MVEVKSLMEVYLEEVREISITDLYNEHRNGAVIPECRYNVKKVVLFFLLNEESVCSMFLY